MRLPGSLPQLGDPIARGTASLGQVARYAGRDTILPTRASSPTAGEDMVDGQRLGAQHPQTVLAGVAVALEDRASAEADRQVGAPVRPVQHDHLRTVERKTHSLDTGHIATRGQPRPIVQRVRSIRLWADDDSMADRDEADRLPGAYDAHRTPTAAENQDFVCQPRHSKLLQSSVGHPQHSAPVGFASTWRGGSGRQAVPVSSAPACPERAGLSQPEYLRWDQGTPVECPGAQETGETQLRRLLTSLLPLSVRV